MGIWVAILPFLGFPAAWKRVLAVLSGAAIAYIAYVINKQRSVPLKEVRPMHEASDTPLHEESAN